MSGKFCDNYGRETDTSHCGKFRAGDSWNSSREFTYTRLAQSGSYIPDSD